MSRSGNGDRPARTGPAAARRPYHHGALRPALLAAAEVILEREGSAGLTLRAVARAAGVSHAAPAHHFTDLAGLLSDLAADGFERFRAAMLEGGEAVDDRLPRMGRAYVRFALDHPNLFLLMFRGERLDRDRPRLGAAMAAAFAALAEAAGAVTGRPAGTPAAAADARADIVAAWSIAHGLAVLLIDGPLRQMVGDGEIDGLVAAALLRLRL